MICTHESQCACIDDPDAPNFEDRSGPLSGSGTSSRSVIEPTDLRIYDGLYGFFWKHSVKEHVGGSKARTLTQLESFRLKVPLSYVVPSTLIHSWLKQTSEFEEAMRSVRRSMPSSKEFQVPLLRLQSTIQNASRPEWWDQFFDSTLRLHGPHKIWIARSNMSVEDGNGSSFAGAFLSIKIDDKNAMTSNQPLPIVRVPSKRHLAGSKFGLDEFSERCWRAVRLVIASAFEESAQRLILANGADPGALQISVLLQLYVTGRKAGVAFSRDPRNVWMSGGLVEWNDGGAEQIVQGTGHSYTAELDRSSPLVLLPIWRKLKRAIRISEKAIGAFVDLEWIYDGKELWIVQARPMSGPEARIARRGRNRRWSRELTMERFPQAMTPMGWSVLQGSLVKNLRHLDDQFGIAVRYPEEMAFNLRGWIYSDPHFFSIGRNVRVRWSRYVIPVCATLWGSQGGGAFAGKVFGGERGIRYNLRVWLSVAGLQLLDGIWGVKADGLCTQWTNVMETQLSTIRNFTAQIREDLNGPVTSTFLLDQMAKLTELSLRFMEPDLAIFLLKSTLYSNLLNLFKALGGSEGEFLKSISFFAENQTVDLNQRTQALARSLANAGATEELLSSLSQCRSVTELCKFVAASLGSLVANDVQNFVSDFGHCRTTWDVAEPCWRENRQAISALLVASFRQLLSRGEKNPWPELHSRIEFRPKGDNNFRDPSLLLGFGGQDQSVLDQASASANQSGIRISDIPAPFTFARAMGAHQSLIETSWRRLLDLMRMDEDHHFWAGHLLEPTRLLLLKAGEILANDGVIENANDVFYFELDELRKALATREPPQKAVMIARRKHEWQRVAQVTPPNELGGHNDLATTSPGHAQFAVQSSNGLPFGNLIQVQPMSPGIAEGPVVFANHLAEASNLVPGAVLVMSSPNPAMAPLFSICGAIVTETGGPLSHGFIAARELGVPAISGIGSWKNTLAAGAIVRVNGSAGTIEVLCRKSEDLVETIL